MGGLTVAETAEALGTSAQTVRTLLRKGELEGHRREWGSRLVWEVTPEAIDEFIAQYGRLDGSRRPRRTALSEPAPDPALEPEPEPEPKPEPEPEAAGSKARPWFLRPRGRATVVVVVALVAFLPIYVMARLEPTALWFEELGLSEVFSSLVVSKVAFHLTVACFVAAFLWANLWITLSTSRARTRGVHTAALLGVTLVTGDLFASQTDSAWTTFLLWQHRQPFGVLDPVHGKDVGFFVFTLPFLLALCSWLLWLMVIAVVYVALTNVVVGSLAFRPWRATFAAQLHLAVLAAGIFVVVAWRLHLEQFAMEVSQPSSTDPHAFAGAGSVDLDIRQPVIGVLTVVCLAIAAALVAAPFIARTSAARAARRVVFAAAVGLGVAAVVGTIVGPMVVQRYVVDPNPLLSEQPYLARSIAATRAALGLDAAVSEAYSPTRQVAAADFPSARARLSRVPVWDNFVLGARMRELVAEPPYYSPEQPTVDIAEVDGKQKLTVVSARELDLGSVPDDGESWFNDRLAYTHGLGLVRFSATDVIDDVRTPKLLDSGLGVEQPRIYFGNLPSLKPEEEHLEAGPPLLSPALDQQVARSSWVLANTRRAEVDLPQQATARAPYHYDGTGGIELTDWRRRAMFAAALGSKELLLSDDITADSRLILHRDVHDRLSTLAPFVTWDSASVPVTMHGRIFFVVHGMTTSTSYPYAQAVKVGATRASYARSSVVATVDAFSGAVALYVTDDSDPIIRAWQQILPNLLRSNSEIPDGLLQRLPYPVDLFDAQSTAYERFHTTQPDVYANGSDVWARPIALSGSLEVAGDIDFDESDEDDLRSTMPPGDSYAIPPGGSTPQLVRGTYYTPRGGQNLVGSLSGWIDAEGRARLAARTLPRDPVTLGPAQVSRVVFADPRVRNLLGLRNLEIRDLDKSSLDSVILGRPHLVFLDGGRVQIQSLYEGSRGPGAARLLGVTAYLNGRAGLGPDIESAVRQALNQPPSIAIRPPAESPVVGTPTTFILSVSNAKREVVTVIAPDGKERHKLRVAQGEAPITWVPSQSGEGTIRVEVTGLDGTTVSRSRTFEILDTPPTLTLIDLPTVVRAGEPLQVRFRVGDATSVQAEISTREGVVFSRRFTIHNGIGLVEWTPDRAGKAVLVIRADGRQGQRVARRLPVTVESAASVSPPTVSIVKVPTGPRVGKPSTVAFTASDCLDATAKITGPDGKVSTWQFACPVSPARLTWTPNVVGTYVFVAVARGDGTASKSTIQLTVRAAS